jgi:outer membrane protein
MIIAVVASALLGQMVPTWSLEDCLRLAHERQPRIEAARAAARGAEARTSQALGGLGLQAGAAASAERLTSPIVGLSSTTSNAPFSLYSVGLNASLPLWDGGRFYAWRQAEKNEEAAQWQERSSILDIDVSVAAALYDYRLALALKDIRAGLAAKTALVLERARGLVQAGRQAPIDAVRAEALYESARAEAVAADATAINANQSLLAALGLPPDTTHGLATAATWETEFPYTATSYAALGLERVPLLQSLRAQREAAQKAVTGSKWGHLPSLLGSGGYGVRARDTSGPWAPNWSVGLTLSVPLFSSGQTYFRTAELRSVLDQISAQEAALTQDIQAAATRNYLQVVTAKERFVALERARQAAQANVEFAEGRYAAGAGSIIEVTDAELLLSNAQVAAVTADRDLRTARVRALAAMDLPLTPVAGK